MDEPPPRPIPSPPQRQRSELSSRIPTASKEYFNTPEKKTEPFTSKDIHCQDTLCSSAINIIGEKKNTK